MSTPTTTKGTPESSSSDDDKKSMFRRRNSAPLTPSNIGKTTNNMTTSKDPASSTMKDNSSNNSKNNPLLFANAAGLSAPKAIVRVQSLGGGSSTSGFGRSGSFSIMRVKSCDSTSGAFGTHNTQQQQQNGNNGFPSIEAVSTFESIESNLGDEGEDEFYFRDVERQTDRSDADKPLSSSDLVVVGSPTHDTFAHSADEQDDDTADNQVGRAPQDKEKSIAVADAEQRPTWMTELTCIAYMSTFAIMATSLRIYMGRFFGLDCEDLQDRGLKGVPDDFLVPLSSRICVTNSGTTYQTGGALFIDLPANILGSFIMGLINPIALHKDHPLPWFHPHHPLQKHWIFHLALRTGFCGSLTTFASWNTQMVEMLDGSFTELGPQVASALFGYIIGVACAVSSFVFGRHAYLWWRATHSVILVPDQNDDDGVREQRLSEPKLIVALGNEEKDQRSSGGAAKLSPYRQDLSPCRKVFEFFVGIRIVPFLLGAGLVAAFLVADFVENIAFYRKMWMSALLAPPGAILRWKLSQWNASQGPFGKRWEWVPWGTFTANIVAAIISLLMQGIETRFVVPGIPAYAWLVAILPAIETGFAGSLSTVSTFVKEIVDMKSPSHQFVYCWGSLLLAMLLGLLCYSPIVRS